MSICLEDYLASHKALQPELLGENGLRRFPLRLPDFPEGRAFKYAWLELPKGFPNNAVARIRLPPENMLRIPHIEEGGKLCIGDGDPGPMSGASPTSRIEQLIGAFYELFLGPWCAGKLDSDFAKEALNYWSIHCERHASLQDAVRKIYTLDGRQHHARIYDARHLAEGKIIIAGGDKALTDRFVAAMGEAQQVRQVLIADIPISFPLTPFTWPHNQAELERLLRARLGRSVAGNFLTARGRRARSIHRIVILRAQECSFGFLLHGGPPTLVRKGYSTRAYRTNKMLPLRVERLDPAWTCGRDQHPEVTIRQKKHILIVGAGALGSPVIEQLAKAGVGHLTVIDEDSLSAANIGRHALGANAVGQGKAEMIAKQFAQRWPSCTFSAIPGSIQHWLDRHDLSGVDLVLDLTGEPDVRLSIEVARKRHACPLLIGWMEPYVAAAHACLLPKGYLWMTGRVDRLNSLQAIEWPEGVMQHEPSCSSTFQSYTPAAASHAVALVAEASLKLLDGNIERPTVHHWIRGQAFLNEHYPGLNFREWAIAAAPFDGVSWETLYE